MFFSGIPALRVSQKVVTIATACRHSFNRVMPGSDYVSSIRDFWCVCAGCDAEARKRVVKFLNQVLNTKDYPLTVMDRPIESETTKIVENSYRATILAYLNEWSVFAERNGVDLIKVINAIKMRPTHTFQPRDVKELVPAYLAECRNRGILQVRIVHGKGTGVLRETVHAILGRLPEVASFRLAGEDGGGWGATIVILRPPKASSGKSRG